jgi:nucleoid DNA-binding protein
MKNISRYDFYYALKEKMGLKLFESKQLTDTLIDTLIEVFQQNDEVLISKFGKFVKYTTNKKKLYNPKTKKYAKIPSKNMLKFIPKKNLLISK